MSVAAERAGARMNRWESAPLRELCDFYNGLWRGKKGPFESVKVIRNTNFKSDGRIDLTDVAVLDVESRQLAKRRLKRNDIIIEKSGGGPKQPVGRVVLFDLDADGTYSFSNFTSVIRVPDAKVVDPVYLHRVLYWWYTSGRTESIQSHSTGIRNLDFNAYKEFAVPLPPLAEQKRIVAVLDLGFAAIDRARAHTEANLTDADCLFNAALENVLARYARDATSTRLGAVCEFENGDRGKNYPGRKAFVLEGIPFINAGHLDSGVIAWNAMNYIPRESYEKLSKGKVQEGDVLFCLRGSLGKFGKVDRDGPGAIASSLVIVRSGPSIKTDFLCMYFKSHACEKMITRHAGGAAQPNLSAADLKKFELQLPKLEDQSEAIKARDAFLASASSLRRKYANKLADLAALRQSLLQKAFAGELT